MEGMKRELEGVEEEEGVEVAEDEEEEDGEEGFGFLSKDPSGCQAVPLPVPTSAVCPGGPSPTLCPSVMMMD